MRKYSFTLIRMEKKNHEKCEFKLKLSPFASVGIKNGNLFEIQ